MRKNIFLYGKSGVGKTTIIKKILEELPLYCGFATKKIDINKDFSQVFIRDATKGFTKTNDFCTAEILRGKYKDAYEKKHGNHQSIQRKKAICIPHSSIFETIGFSFLSNIPLNAFILMDEIGFLESKAPHFSKKILSLLNEKNPIIGVIKKESYPLLDEIRKHPNTILFEITMKNRNIQFKRIKDYCLSVLKETSTAPKPH